MYGIDAEGRVYGQEEMTKEQAAKLIQDIIDNRIETLLAEAMKLADTHGLDFTFEPSQIGTYYGTGHKYDEDDPEEDPSGEGRWEPSSWNSSSLYC